ncbi:MAG: AbrB/MazE/SpoVT family DNA-binding domain-containing protein [Chloroflexi bacterium]|nr:AbrB/MazE/SpoVT family DNA-binding domain-containing protein [Chloroflexota bacterium]
MAQGTITSKGQVTIPKAIREALSLFAGDKVEFVLTENDETVMRPITKRVDDVFGRLYKQGRTAVSIEEMNAVVKKRAQKSVS